MIRLFALLWTLLWTLPVLGHGLIVSVTDDGREVSGSIVYTDGMIGASEWVEVHDLDAPDAAPLRIRADENGRYRFPASPGGRYRIIVEGDEGHVVERMHTVGARPGLFDEGVPIYVWLGLLLLGSLLPAWWLGRRRPPAS